MNFEAIVYETDIVGSWQSHTTAQRRAAVVKGLEYLGPWCSRCGKKGKTCKAGNEACRKRRTTHAFRGCNVKALQGLSLPAPSTAWISEKYGARATEYQSGGRARQGTRVHLPSYVNRNDAAIQYAYEISMGIWDENEEMAA